MTTIKEIAKMLHALGRKASMDGAREYVLSHYDSAMPAYWQDPRASLNVLDALMETRIADSYESLPKATLRISTELDAAIEHAPGLSTTKCLSSSTTSTLSPHTTTTLHRKKFPTKERNNDRN